MNLFGMLKSWFGKYSRALPGEATTGADWEYRFKSVELAVSVLTEFCADLNNCAPGELPEHIASIRGWTIRFMALPEYCEAVPTNRLEDFVTALDEPSVALSTYLEKCRRYSMIRDPIMESSEYMRSYDLVVGHAAVLNERVLFAHRAVSTELVRRHRTSGA